MSSDTTKEQPSPEVWEAQQQELARLARRVAELEENERKTLERLKDGHSAHALILRGDIAVSRRQLAHLLGDAYQELFVKLEESGTKPESPHNAPSLPQEPPVPVSAGDSSSGQKYRVAWRSCDGSNAGHGEWFDCREDIEASVERLNRVEPDEEHWLEEATS